MAKENKKEKAECELCGEEVKLTFLDKLVGTIIHDKCVCSACQREHKEKLSEKVKEKIGKK